MVFSVAMVTRLVSIETTGQAIDEGEIVPRKAEDKHKVVTEEIVYRDRKEPAMAMPEHTGIDDSLIIDEPQRDSEKGQLSVLAVQRWRLCACFLGNRFSCSFCKRIAKDFNNEKLFLLLRYVDFCCLVQCCKTLR